MRERNGREKEDEEDRGGKGGKRGKMVVARERESARRSREEGGRGVASGEKEREVQRVRGVFRGVAKLRVITAREDRSAR